MQNEWPKSIRHQIAESFVTYIKTRDWIFNVVPVHVGKGRYKNDEIPGISIFFPDETGERGSYNEQQNKMMVDLSLIDTIPRYSDDDKYDLLDVTEWVRAKLIQVAVNADLDDLADPPVYTNGTIEYPSTEDLVFKIGVSFEINYETKLRDPYSQ